MLKKLRYILLLMLFTAGTAQTYAQMSYNAQNNKFTLTSVSNLTYPQPSDFGMELNGFHKFILFNSDNKFVVNTKNVFTYIYASSWVVEFYNPTTKIFNDVCAMDFRTSANGEVYPASSGDSPLEVVKSLTPVKYTDADNTVIYGILPEDLQATLPESVTLSPTGEKGIDYISILPVLAGSIMELKERAAENTALINSLSSNP